MKLVRPLLIALGIIVLFVALLAGVALTPLVQRWALRRVLAERDFGFTLDVQSVSAGPNSVSLGNVSLTQGNIRMTLDQVEAEYSLSALIFGGRLQLDHVQARGVTLDLSRVAPQRTALGVAAALVAALGALGRIKLPFALFLGDLDVGARVLLSGEAGHLPPPVELKITGGSVAPGREGTVNVKALWRDPSPGARVTSFDVQARLLMAQSLGKTFDRIGLTALVDAQGPGFPGQHQLKLAAGLTRAGGRDDYQFQLDTVRDGRSEEMIFAQGHSVAGRDELAGDWRLTARTAQLEPFFIGGALPDFAAVGTGRFSFGVADHRLALDGKFKSETTDFSDWRPALRALGAVNISGEFDLTYANGEGLINRGLVTLAGDHPVAELKTSGPVAFDVRHRRIRLKTGAPGEIARLKLTALPVGWARPFLAAVDVNGGGISGELVLAGTAANTMTVTTNGPLTVDRINVLRAGRSLVTQAGLRFEAAAEFSPEAARVQIHDLSLRNAAGDSLAAAVTLGGPPTAAWPATLEGSFQADLPKFLSRWVPVGTVHAKGTAQLAFAGGRVEVRRLAADSSDDKGRLIGAVEVTRPFTFDPGSRQVETDGTKGEMELATVRFGTLPLAVLSRQFSAVKFGGWTNPGEIKLLARDEKLILRGQSPLRISELSLALPGRPMLERINAEFSPALELSGRSFSRATAEGVVLRDSNGVQLAALNGDVTRTSDGGLRTALTFDFDLPVLSGQPILARNDSLSAGRASGEVRAVTDSAALQVEARATLNGLVAREGGQVLPVANLNLRAVIRADGHISVQAPVLLDRAGQRSDIGFSAEGTRQPAGLMLDAKITSEHLELADVLALCAVVGAPFDLDLSGDSAPQNRALSPPAADELPFWTGVQGQLTVAAKSVTQGKDWAMTGLAGRLAVQSTQVQLAKLEAGFGENGKLSARGGLDFVPGLNPYQLTGDFSLTEFDVSRFYKALEPDRPPACEGLFSVKGQLEGRGLTLGDTLDRTRGQFDLTSRQGIFRGLKRASEKLSMATKAVELGAALGSLIGSDKVKEATEKVAGSAYYADQLAQGLAEIKYDQLSLKITRDESLDVKLQDVVLVSQEVRLLGQGQVTYVAGKPLLQQPLTASFALAARGKTGDILDKLHLLDGTNDELGYAKAREAVTIGGSLSRPDPTPFFVRLATAAKPAETPAPGN